jgi:hypothetical protein
MPAPAKLVPAQAGGRGFVMWGRVKCR